jgi:hypothetical protein
MNPLFQQYGNQNNMLQQFMQFKQTFNGDPKQTVQQLLSSGKMSQSQFNQLAQQASQLQKMFNL